MADNNGRPFTRSEDRTTRYRLYPVAGTPTFGDGVVVNADLDLEFSAAGGTSPDAVITNHTTPEIVFSRTGEVIYSRGI